MDLALTPEQEQTLDLYVRLTSEAMARIEWIDATIGMLAPKAKLVSEENCYLQLRKICELIAISCLAIHGDLDVSRKLQTQWHAAKILSKLTKLHEDFYPHPFEDPIVSKDGTTYVERDLDSYLTREKLRDLYELCGDVLHVGTLSKLMLGSRSHDADFEKIKHWSLLCRNLLVCHSIHLKGVNLGFFFQIDLRSPLKIRVLNMSGPLHREISSSSR